MKRMMILVSLLCFPMTAQAQFGLPQFESFFRSPGDLGAEGFIEAYFEFVLGAIGGKQQQAPEELDPELVALGEVLFEEETFGGNGRTCATCHIDGEGFGLNPSTIANLPADDLLFIAEFPPEVQQALGVDLPPFDADNPTVPAFEAPELMRDGLILENIFGFEVDDDGLLIEPPVFRVSTGLSNLGQTAPYGHSGNIPNLQEFAAGAVVQHFTRSLNREPGVDFRMPTAEELAALEAYMLDQRSHNTFNIAAILATVEDDALRAQAQQGERDFRNNNCRLCHNNAVLGNRRNFATGVEDLNEALPRDRGGGSLRRPNFSTPQLFDLNQEVFFHNNPGREFGASKLPLHDRLVGAISFYNTAEFRRASGIRINLNEQELDNIATFLGVLAVPNLEVPVQQQQGTRRFGGFRFGRR